MQSYVFGDGSRTEVYQGAASLSNPENVDMLLEVEISESILAAMSADVDTKESNNSFVEVTIIRPPEACIGYNKQNRSSPRRKTDARRRLEEKLEEIKLKLETLTDDSEPDGVEMAAMNRDTLNTLQLDARSGVERKTAIKIEPSTPKGVAGPATSRRIATTQSAGINGVQKGPFSNRIPVSGLVVPAVQGYSDKSQSHNTGKIMPDQYRELWASMKDLEAQLIQIGQLAGVESNSVPKSKRLLNRSKRNNETYCIQNNNSVIKRKEEMVYNVQVETPKKHTVPKTASPHVSPEYQQRASTDRGAAPVTSSMNNRVSYIEKLVKHTCYEEKCSHKNGFCNASTQLNGLDNIIRGTWSAPVRPIANADTDICGMMDYIDTSPNNSIRSDNKHLHSVSSREKLMGCTFGCNKPLHINRRESSAASSHVAETEECTDTDTAAKQTVSSGTSASQLDQNSRNTIIIRRASTTGAPSEKNQDDDLNITQQQMKYAKQEPGCTSTANSFQEKSSLKKVPCRTQNNPEEHLHNIDTNYATVSKSMYSEDTSTCDGESNTRGPIDRWPSIYGHGRVSSPHREPLNVRRRKEHNITFADGRNTLSHEDYYKLCSLIDAKRSSSTRNNNGKLNIVPQCVDRSCQVPPTTVNATEQMKSQTASKRLITQRDEAPLSRGWSQLVDTENGYVWIWDGKKLSPGFDLKEGVQEFLINHFERKAQAVTEEQKSQQDNNLAQISREIEHELCTKLHECNKDADRLVQLKNAVQPPIFAIPPVNVAVHTAENSQVLTPERPAMQKWSQDISETEKKTVSSASRDKEIKREHFTPHSNIQKSSSTPRNSESKHEGKSAGLIPKGNSSLHITYVNPWMKTWTTVSDNNNGVSTPEYQKPLSNNCTKSLESTVPRNSPSTQNKVARDGFMSGRQKEMETNTYHYTITQKCGKQEAVKQESTNLKEAVQRITSDKSKPSLLSLKGSIKHSSSVLKNKSSGSKKCIIGKVRNYSSNGDIEIEIELSIKELERLLKQRQKQRRKRLSSSTTTVLSKVEVVQSGTLNVAKGNRNLERKAVDSSIPSSSQQSRTEL